MANLDDRRLLGSFGFVLQWLVVSVELWSSSLLMGKGPNQEVFHRLLRLSFDDFVQRHHHLCWSCPLLSPSFEGFLLTWFCNDPSRHPYFFPSRPLTRCRPVHHAPRSCSQSASLDPDPRVALSPERPRCR